MIENKYFENIKKELKVKYPKLDFNFDLEYNNDLDYAYCFSFRYEVNDIIMIIDCIWIDSAEYNGDGIPKITIEKPIVSYVEADTNKIDNKYFELIASKGVEGLALVKDCADYFNKTYKKEILKVLRKENEKGKD